MVLDLDDDMQHEDQCHHIHHCRRRLFRLDYFFAGSAVFVSTLAAGASLLTGVALASTLASTLQVLSLAGSHLAVAAGAGAAVLAGSVAKAAVATKVAITVAIVFI
jgi:hypothetical protein